jgi:hypothetical protein
LFFNREINNYFSSWLRACSLNELAINWNAPLVFLLAVRTHRLAGRVGARQSSTIERVRDMTGYEHNSSAQEQVHDVEGIYSECR